jgi:hypothetical protein
MDRLEYKNDPCPSEKSQSVRQVEEMPNSGTLDVEKLRSVRALL